MSEAEAKERMCPFTFNVPTDRAVGPIQWRCVAAECMAWRVRDIRLPDDGYCALIERP